MEAILFTPWSQLARERTATSLGRGRSQATDATGDHAEPIGGARLRFSHVGKRFGEKRVVDALGLTVEPGEFLAIVGRSGCGKSTLLRIALGLETADEGRVELSAEGGVGAPTARLMFQEPRLLPWQSVLHNVALGVPRAASPHERLERARRALAEVGLCERGDDWPAVLSGGQRQRVALARALVSRPRLLALDEPLGALDALTRIEMQALLETVWQAERFTAVLVTHDVSEAVRMADRVVVMEAGRIAYEERINLPRPRRHGEGAIAAAEGRILERLLQPAAAR